jgi:hypothetical protein
MRRARSADFDLEAVYTALDTQRRARGMTWPQVAGEIGRRFDGRDRILRFDTKALHSALNDQRVAKLSFVWRVFIAPRAA